MNMNMINFVKGIIFYVTVFMGSLTLCINYDESSFSSIMAWFIILFGFGFITYMIFSKSSEEEIRTFTGVNYIKNRFNIDLLSEE